MWRELRGGLVCGAIGLAACGDVERFPATGVVESVSPPEGQIVIAHDAIPGFMPAMTMSFDARAELLEGVSPGDRVRFELERSPLQLRIRSLEVASPAPAAVAPAPAPVSPLPAEARAPDFQLTDQDGRPLALSDLAGKVVVLDFVFTTCPGPCPILTSRHVQLQRHLSRELAGRTWLVSVSVDPRNDTPERLRAYATARGASFENWSFLTGPPEEVDRVLAAYGVGRGRQPDGNLIHGVVTYLIAPDGGVAQRYLGLETDPLRILRDVRALLL